MNRYLLYILLPLLYLWALHSTAQNPEANNYTFSTNNTSSLTTTGSGWTTIINSGENHTTFNDGFGSVPASSVVSLPFEVWFMGERFTSFSINTNGVFRFGSTPILSEGNTYNITGHARLCPFSASSTIGGVLDDGDWQTGLVRYQVTGSAPNRVLIVQCNNMRVSYNSGSSDANFEIRVYETARVNSAVPASSGQIEFIYGNMRNSGGEITSGNIGIGYEGASGTNDYLSVDISNHTASTGATSNTYPSGTITRLNSSGATSRRLYRFNPVQVTGQEVDASASCATTTSFILDWTDNATNEVGIVLYRSTDGVNYTFDRQLPANTTSATITGLTPNTTYHYQIYAVTEGKLSQLATTGTVTITTQPTGANIWYADASSNWNTTTTWINNSVPTSTSDVVISCKTPRTVTVATTAANDCRTLTILANNVLNINTGQTLRVRGDVSNSGTINLNGGTLIIEGNLTNTNTATINAGTGFLRVAGNYTNAGVFNSQFSTIQFDGTAQQLINHTGTSSGQRIESSTTTSYNNDVALVSPATTTTYNNTTDINIPNNNTTGITRTITVPTTTATITDITVGLQINHNNVGDLFVTLQSPSGTTVTLINRINSGLGTCTRNNISATLSDAAGNDVQTRCISGNINGTHRPAQALSAFDGENPSGTWTLHISDRSNATTNVGEFRDWDLNISVSPTPGLIIPDNSSAGIDHKINVPTSAIVQSITMSLAIEHTYIGDLIVTLTSPTGTTRTMMTRVTSGSGGCSGDNLSITFDDLAATAVQTQCGGGTPSINGTFQPSQTLGGFVGQNQQGDWTINVADRYSNDIGRIMSASLTIVNQQITTFPLSSNLYFHNMIVLNTGAGVRTQNTNIHITNTSTWTDGVFTADNNHMFIFVDNATSTLPTNASHADMRVRKIGNDAFHFPVGNSGWGAPISISAPTNTAHHFTAQYFRQVTPYDPFSKEATIHHVGQCEYWILDRTNGASNVVVTLSYDDIRSCTVGPTSGLKVVRWDGSIWRDHFNGGIMNVPYDGVLSSGTVNNFSPFTLGALTELNILPLELLDFDAKPVQQHAILNWTTTKEVAHKHFEIERSLDGVNFDYIGVVVEPSSLKSSEKHYTFIDENVGLENKTAYYRLKQVDEDDSFAYSVTREVNWNAIISTELVIYPNPFTEQLNVQFNLDKSQRVQLRVFDMAGRLMFTSYKQYQQGVQFTPIDLAGLSNGTYLLEITSELGTLNHREKIIKQ